MYERRGNAALFVTAALAGRSDRVGYVPLQIGIHRGVTIGNLSPIVGALEMTQRTHVQCTRLESPRNFISRVSK